MSVPPGAPPIDHHWEAGPDDVKRLTSAAIRWAYRQPRLWIPLVVVLGALAVIAAAAAHDGGRPALAGVIFGVVVIMVFVPAILLRRARAQFALIAFPGARWEIGYGPSSMVIVQPISSAVIDYSAFKSATRASGNTVILKFRSRLYTVLPEELCPPAALAFLTEAIARSRPR